MQVNETTCSTKWQNIGNPFKMLINGGGGSDLLLSNLVLCCVFFQCELIAPSIVKELAKGLDPLKTCETVKLCTNGSRGTSV